MLNYSRDFKCLVSGVINVLTREPGRIQTTDGLTSKVFFEPVFESYYFAHKGLKAQARLC